jgi:hypothetical protein
MDFLTSFIILGLVFSNAYVMYRVVSTENKVNHIEDYLEERSEFEEHFLKLLEEAAKEKELEEEAKEIQ